MKTLQIGIPFYPVIIWDSPLLLKKGHLGDLILQIFLKKTGELFGAVSSKDLSYKVPLKGLPIRLDPSHLKNAESIFENSRLEWDGTFLKVHVRALGGGPNQSRDRFPREQATKPIFTPVEQPIAATAFNNITPTLPAEKPLHCNLPEKNERFVGREFHLQEIKRRFQAEGITTLNVSGLGGVGKTSLVLEALHRNIDHYSLVWWISCDQPLSDFRELGEALGITTPLDKGEQVIEVVRGWLEEHSDWALVFDNMETSSAIASFCPMHSKRGHIITTSRNPFSRESLNVGNFSLDESVALLLKLTAREKEEDVERLAEALGNLALALTQAGTYMDQTKTSFSDYLTLFEKVRKELWADETPPEDYPETVGTTWTISVKKIAEELPEAIGMLNTAAFLAPDNMPKELFAKAGQSHLVLQKRFHKLQQYSFLEVGQKPNSYSMHRLVQASTRDKMPKESQKLYMQEILLSRFKRGWDDFDPKIPATWIKARPLVTHLAEWCQHRDDPELLGQQANFLGLVGLYYGTVEVNPTLAIKYHTQELEIKKGIYGENHSSVFAVMNCLSMAYLESGNSEQALLLSNKVQKYNQRQTKKGPLNAANQINLGVIHLKQDNPNEAIGILLEALKSNRAAGNNEAVISSLHNLGLAYLKAGDSASAKNNLTEALTACKKVFGPNHFHVAEILGALGGLALDQKNPKKALEHFQQAVEIEREVFGKSHPSTALNLANIGCAYAELKQTALERDYLNQALAMQEEVYGKEHPAVALTLNNLGYSYMQEDSKESALIAVPYFMRAFLIRAKTLPPKHQDTLFSLAFFLKTRKAAGKEQELLPNLKPSDYL